MLRKRESPLHIAYNLIFCVSPVLTGIIDIKTQMNQEQILLNKWRTLPLEKQQEVLDFVEQLCRTTLSTKSRY